DIVRGVPAGRPHQAAVLQWDQVVDSGGADDAGPPHRVRGLSGIDFGRVTQLPGQCGILVPYKISPNVDCSK
ncbi:hypothetical protein MUK42_30581, partial [Musa troglodytarum]